MRERMTGPNLLHGVSPPGFITFITQVVEVEAWNYNVSSRSFCCPQFMYFFCCSRGLSKEAL